MAGAAVAFKSALPQGACLSKQETSRQTNRESSGLKAAQPCRRQFKRATSVAFSTVLFGSSSETSALRQGVRQSQSSRQTISRQFITRAAAAGAGPGGGSILTPELRTAVDEFLVEHKVVLFMKGNREFPQCGFSNTCIQILNMIQAPYETVNILENETLRAGMKEYSSWPTFPQLYIDGEFVGGCDIAIELFQKGELKEIVEKALVS